MSEETQGLLLTASSLASKWGFNDGDCPDWILDVCDERGLPYPIDWHNTLRGLVRDYLLPEFPDGERPEVYDIETSHNPIRTDDFTDDDAPDVEVMVPLETVLTRTCVVKL